MRRYETFYITDPDISEDERTPVLQRIEEIVSEQNTFIIDVDDWGMRKLAYEIKKKTRGYYVRLDYCGTGDLVNEIERFFRIDDRVIKYMTVLLEEHVDAESLKEEVARKKAEKELAEKEQAEKEKKVLEKETPSDQQDTGSAQNPDSETDSDQKKATEPEAETADPQPTETEKKED